MMQMSTCHHCGHPFYSLKRNRPFCSPVCRHAYSSAESDRDALKHTEININPANLDGASLNDQGNNRAA